MSHPTTTDQNVEKTALEQLISECKRRLDLARSERDELKIALAESALNDLLDRY